MTNQQGYVLATKWLVLMMCRGVIRAKQGTLWGELHVATVHKVIGAVAMLDPPLKVLIAAQQGSHVFVTLQHRLHTHHPDTVAYCAAHVQEHGKTPEATTSSCRPTTTGELPLNWISSWRVYNHQQPAILKSLPALVHGICTGADMFFKTVGCSRLHVRPEPSQHRRRMRDTSCGPTVLHTVQHTVQHTVLGRHRISGTAVGGGWGGAGVRGGGGGGRGGGGRAPAASCCTLQGGRGGLRGQSWWLQQCLSGAPGHGHRLGLLPSRG